MRNAFPPTHRLHHTSALAALARLGVSPARPGATALRPTLRCVHTARPEKVRSGGAFLTIRDRPGPAETPRPTAYTAFAPTRAVPRGDVAGKPLLLPYLGPLHGAVFSSQTL